MSAFELGEREEEEEKGQGGLPDPPSDYPCEEEGELEGVESSAPLPPFPPIPVSSGPPIKAKEVVLISLALLLLACSVLLFFKHWKKNYRDINQLPYYAYLYQKEDADFAAAPPPPPDSVAVGGPASAAEAASAPQQPPPPALPAPPQSSQQVVSSMVRAQSGNRFLRVHTNKGSLQNVYLVASREGGGCSSEADGGVERANCSSSNSRSAAADPGAAAAAAALLANRRALLNRAASSPRLLNRCSSVKLHPHSVRLGSVVAAASASSANARFKQQAQPRLTMPPMMAPAPLAALPSVPKAPSSNSGGSSSFTPPVRRSPVHHHHPSPGQRPPPPLRRHLAPKRAASDVYIRFNKCRNELMRRIQSGHQLSEEDDEGSKNPSQGESLASLTGIQRAPPSQAAAECFEEEKEEEEEEEVVEVSEQHPSRYTTSSSMGQPSSANRSPALSSPLQILDGEEERGLRCRPAEEEEEEVKGGQEDCRRIGDLHSSLGSSSSSSSSSFQVNNSPCQEDEREVHPAETKPSSWWLSRGIEENGEAEGGGGGNREEGEDKKVAKGAAGGDNEVERGREEEEENEEVEEDEDEETAGEDHDPPSSWVQKSSSVTTDV